VLVLLVLGPHGPIARFSPLPERQTAGGPRGGLGREVIGRRESTARQLRMGAAICKVSGPVGGVKGDGRQNR
jgi:hypothetical protein